MKSKTNLEPPPAARPVTAVVLEEPQLPDQVVNIGVSPPQPQHTTHKKCCIFCAIIAIVLLIFCTISIIVILRLYWKLNRFADRDLPDYFQTVRRKLTKFGHEKFPAAFKNDSRKGFFRKLMRNRNVKSTTEQPQRPPSLPNIVELIDDDFEPDFSEVIFERAPDRYQVKETGNVSLELFVFIDPQVIRQNRLGDNYENYVIDLLMQSDVYLHDPSLEHQVTLALMGTKVIEDYLFKNGTTFDEKPESRSYWETFGDFQHQYFDENEKIARPDVAVFLTKKPMCDKSQKCYILGTAGVGSVCKPKRACAIITDTGFTTSLTIAHEIGHLLNMKHDFKERCRGPIGFGTFMEPSTYFNKQANWVWSNCSNSDWNELLSK